MTPERGFFYTLILIGVFCYLVSVQLFNLFGGVIYTSIRYIFLPFLARFSLPTIPTHHTTRKSLLNSP